MGTAIIAISGALVALLVLVIWNARKDQLREPRLEGTWRSDAEATISEWHKNRPLNENQEKLSNKTFGKMRITYKGHNYTRELDGAVTPGPFRVLKRGKKLVVIKAGGLLFKNQVFKIRFQDDDTYWVFLDQTDTWECFRRVK
jgi:hypothetical protein